MAEQEEMSMDDVVNSIVSEMDGDNEVETTGNPQPEPKDQVKDPDELDFGDMPNGRIRYDKIRGQKDKLSSEVEDLKRQLAERDGKLSVLERSEDDNGDSDVTEYMDEPTKALYDQNKELTNIVKQLSDEVINMKKGKIVENLSKKEEVFFQTKPELKEKRDEVVSEVRDYLSDRPGVRKLLRTGGISFNELYAMVKADSGSSKQGVKAKSQNPDNVFGKKNSSESPGGSFSDDSTDVMSEAKKALEDPNSTNKREATAALMSMFSDSVLNQLDE